MSSNVSGPAGQHFAKSLIRGSLRGLWAGIVAILYPEARLVWYLAKLGGHEFSHSEQCDHIDVTPVRAISIVAHIMGAVALLVLGLLAIAPPPSQRAHVQEQEQSPPVPVEIFLPPPSN